MTARAIAIPASASASLVIALFAAPAFGQDARSTVPIVVDEVPAEERAALHRDPNWEPPRTSWGHPSLQGTWSSDDMFDIPRERPAEFGAREKLTPEEFAVRAREEAEYRDRILNQESYYSRSWSVRSFGYSSQIVDPPNGRMPAAAATAVPRKTRGSYSGGPYDGFDDFNLYDRCITRGFASLVPSPARYGNGIYIAQSPEAVTITYEMVHETRVINLTDAPAPAGVRQYLGTSRGRWEGDTLVVETTNLTDETSIGDVQNSTAMKLTERFRRVDPDMIEYIGTVEDPQAFTAPFTYRLMITKHPGYRLYEYSCHEGNTAVSQGLSGEREFERQVAAAIARGEPPPTHERTDGLGPLPEDDSRFININEGE